MVDDDDDDSRGAGAGDGRKKTDRGGRKLTTEQNLLWYRIE